MSQNTHLQQVVLHDVPDDAKFIKVTTSALSSKGLLEADDHRRDVVSIPSGSKEHVGKPECFILLIKFNI